MPQRCGNCLASEPLRLPAKPGEQQGKVLGTCHLAPPTPIATPEGIRAIYPMVNPFNGWCLQWQAKHGFNQLGERIELGEPQPVPGVITKLEN